MFPASQRKPLISPLKDIYLTPICVCILHYSLDRYMVFPLRVYRVGKDTGDRVDLACLLMISQESKGNRLQWMDFVF